MDIRIPEIGESIIEAKLAKWHCQDGAQVSKDDLLCELETDKITLELFAETDGIVSIRIQEGETVPVGEVIASLAEEPASKAEKPAAKAEKPAAKAEKPAAKAEKPAAKAEKPAAKAEKPASKAEKPAAKAVEPAAKAEEPAAKAEEPAAKAEEPAAKAEKSVGEPPQPGAPFPPTEEGHDQQAASEERLSRREPLSPLRRTIAKRLLEARQQTAMATTFNEADLSRIMELRNHHGERFLERHGVKLGLMSFFVKACIEALREFPVINARLEEDAIVYQQFYDIGIAVSTEQGLVAPVLRDADRLHFADIEKQIAELADKARKHRLTLADLQGGTFSISNGGVYGSLLSTPLLNPPQSAILGMHAIQQRAVVRDDQIVARPMMYLALSYDHRLIDGREAVSFLKRVVELVEEPEELLLE
jgi:2-oxoglutarate dehydrogenase E2 component (dihydrolipoamide succinyltransferase)